MHPYTTDSSERRTVPLYIVGLSILCAWLLSKVLSYFQLTVPWWVDAPSVVGFYGVIYGIFDRWLWRCQPFKKIGLVKVPDMNGQWRGYISSSFDDYAVRQDVVVEIRQSWTRISVKLEAELSRSHSLIGSILTDQPDGIVLTYEYLNEPKPNARPTMHAHRGTARLIVENDVKVLKGEYYTGRDRQNYGVLYLKRVGQGNSGPGSTDK